MTPRHGMFQETALLHSKRSEKVPQQKKKLTLFSAIFAKRRESACTHITFFTTPPKYGMNIHLSSSEMNVFLGFFFRIWEPTRRMFGMLQLLPFHRGSVAKSLGANCTTTLRTSKSAAGKVSDCPTNLDEMISET